MNVLLKLEELALLVLAYLAHHFFDFPEWWFWVFFLAPDISFVFYLFGQKKGAWGYNLFHHRGLAVGLFILGYVYEIPNLIFIGILLFAHSSFDRLMGYGLKHESSFNNTHLGKIGKKD